MILALSAQFFFNLTLYLVAGVTVFIIGYRMLLYVMRSKQPPRHQYPELERIEPIRTGGTIQFKYSVPTEMELRLRLLSSEGKEVRLLADKVHMDGAYEVSFDTTEVPNGSYRYQLTGKSGTFTKKLVIDNVSQS